MWLNNSMYKYLNIAFEIQLKMLQTFCSGPINRPVIFRKIHLGSRRRNLNLKEDILAKKGTSNLERMYYVDIGYISD